MLSFFVTKSLVGLAEEHFLLASAYSSASILRAVRDCAGVKEEAMPLAARDALEIGSAEN